MCCYDVKLEIRQSWNVSYTINIDDIDVPSLILFTLPRKFDDMSKSNRMELFALWRQDKIHCLRSERENEKSGEETYIASTVIHKPGRSSVLSRVAKILFLVFVHNARPIWRIISFTRLEIFHIPGCTLVRSMTYRSTTISAKRRKCVSQIVRITRKWIQLLHCTMMDGSAIVCAITTHFCRVHLRIMYLETDYRKIKKKCTWIFMYVTRQTLSTSTHA